MSIAKTSQIPQRFSGKWETKRVSEFGNIVTGATPSTKVSVFWDGAFPWITPTDISSDRDMTVSERMITQEGLNAVRALPPNTVLVTCIASIGKNAILKTAGSCNQQINAVTPNSAHNAEFLYYLFEYSSDFLLANAGITATNIVSKSTFSNLVFEIPALEEQRAIAKTLSDVDGLLNTLEALITKKHAIKQAVMQQLLTGKTRLPSFNGAWETKRLGELGEISGAGVDKKINPNETPVRLVNYLDVYNKAFLYSKDLTHEVSARPDQARRCVVENGDIFFTPSSEVPDDIGCSAVAMEDIPDSVYSYHVVRLRLKTDWDLYFRAYIFNTNEFLNQASRQCDGSGTRYVISLPKFRAMTVRFPPDIEEQHAIASVLSDMDAEITALEQRRDKTHAIKQAMMQQLLTGRVRLFKNGAE